MSTTVVTIIKQHRPHFCLLKQAFVFVVAIQCLETAFEVSTDDQSLTIPMSLPEIFTSATSKVTPPDRAEPVTDRLQMLRFTFVTVGLLLQLLLPVKTALFPNKVP